MAGLICDLVDLTTWTKKQDILKTISKTLIVKDLERTFRRDVAVNNRLYLDGDADHYIVHGPNGYKWAENEAEIELSVKDLESRAFTMLAESRRVRRALSSRDQGAMNEVAYYRKAANMTATSLVNLINHTYPNCNIDVPTLSRIETGKVLPNTGTMIAISDVLGVSPVKLFGSYAILI